MDDDDVFFDCSEPLFVSADDTHQLNDTAVAPADVDTTECSAAVRSMLSILSSGTTNDDDVQRNTESCTDVTVPQTDVATFSKPRRSARRPTAVRPADPAVVAVLDALHPERGSVCFKIDAPCRSSEAKVVYGEPAIMLHSVCAACGKKQEEKTQQGATTCTRPECAEVYTAWQCVHCSKTCSVEGDSEKLHTPACCSGCGKTSVLVRRSFLSACQCPCV